jgi:hypothetical protein
LFFRPASPFPALLARIGAEVKFDLAVQATKRFVFDALEVPYAMRYPPPALPGK